MSTYMSIAHDYGYGIILCKDMCKDMCIDFSKAMVLFTHVQTCHGFWEP